MKYLAIALLALFVVAIAGCTASQSPLTDVPANDGSLAGFWLGLWHGMIAPFTFIISLFIDSVNVYEVHNSGGWYNFGFILGVGGFSLGASLSRSSK